MDSFSADGGLTVLAVVARLIRRFGDSEDASCEAWRVLVAGCTLYLLGELFSWPIAIVFRENFTTLPLASRRGHLFSPSALLVGVAFLGWGTFLLITARQRTWLSLRRHIGVAFALLIAFILLDTIVTSLMPIRIK